MSKLSYYRKKFNLTQKKLAEKVGVTSDYISQIERGRTPGIDTARKIAEIFNSTIDEIFFDRKTNN